MINFRFFNSKYDSILHSIVNPIEKYLPQEKYTKGYQDTSGETHVSFFTEDRPHYGIFQCHGMACKNYHTAKIVQDYDHILVTGDTWKQKYIDEGIPESKIFVNGWSKLDPIFNGEIIKTPNDKITVLFAPTHVAIFEVSLFPHAHEILKMIPNTYNVIMSEHPAIKANNKPTLQFLADADIVISDSSSIIYEAWSLGKRVIFLDWIVKEGIEQIFSGSFEDYIYKNNIGLHAQSKEHFWDLLDYASKYYLDYKTEDFIEGIFPRRLRGNSGKITAEILLQLDMEKT